MMARGARPGPHCRKRKETTTTTTTTTTTCKHPMIAERPLSEKGNLPKLHKLSNTSLISAFNAYGVWQLASNLMEKNVNAEIARRHINYYKEEGVWATTPILYEDEFNADYHVPASKEQSFTATGLQQYLTEVISVSPAERLQALSWAFPVPLLGLANVSKIDIPFHPLLVEEKFELSDEVGFFLPKNECYSKVYAFDDAQCAGSFARRCTGVVDLATLIYGYALEGDSMKKRRH
ncbi:uncharacterized protein J3D65DRAFT_666419 [Phyllosticta citribraziliensis]|uniref:Uncharacterized protein n=1 Tax=Phyllosticta citribraziliensis TaxID=989973 RepID=A0ABR1LWZ5_9PEZI